MSATTLPATGTPAPTRDWAIIDAIHFRGRDGLGISAKLTRNGTPVASVHDEGTGGGMWPYFSDPEAQAAFTETVEAWEGEFPLGDGTSVPWSTELVLEVLVEEHDLAKQLSDTMKEGLVMFKTGHRDELFVLKTGARSPKRVAVEIALRTELAGHTVWDGTDWVAVPATAA